jgi:hypothetical protein
MNAVIAYDDRESINRCLMYRYIISYEPMNFKGHLEDFPLTLEYGKRVDALRRRYRGYLWDGEFRDKVGVTVRGAATAAAALPAPDPGKGEELVHTVFVRRDSGKRAIVIANHYESQSLDVSVEARPSLGYAVVVTPEDPEPAGLALPLHVPARSVAVILEGVS